jgi:adenylyl-sulfate kinase
MAMQSGERYDLARHVGEGTEPASRNIRREEAGVAAGERAALLGQSPLTIWLTGLPGSGKSTLARAVERRLYEAGRLAIVLDGDNLRHGLNRDLGFSPEDRRENIRRTAEAARLLNDAGVIAITALISPYRDDRELARAVVGPARFLEVHVDASAGECERRDPKGLWSRARRGEIRMFTGVDAPYEAPEAPGLRLATQDVEVAACVEKLLATLVPRLAPGSQP